jgi:hypothetical protein
MRRWFAQLFANISRRLSIKIDRTPEVLAENRLMRRYLADNSRAFAEEQQKREYLERVSELVEARRMGGVGPWRVDDAVLAETDHLISVATSKTISREPGGIAVRESSPVTQAGATGDIELALQNVEWRREINLSWLEFSRWGIQQIILISRLYYIKNPMIQRGINVTANYVFGRGVEVMSEDDDANEVMKDAVERNKKVLGQAALSDLHKRLQYDGQVFYCFFPDPINTGKTSIRTIDATEMFEIVTDPDDTDQHWFYLRKWTSRIVDPKTGTPTTKTMEAYYPALNYEPAAGIAVTFAGKPVMRNTPVLMQKGGVGIGKWHFDTPKAYAALDWAKNGRRLLEADLTTRLSLSQITMQLTTKGGQQALEGAKQELGTTIGPTSNLWDMNPPAVSGGIFASGPGTTLSAFNTSGAIRDPSDVAEYRNMVAIVFEIPPTFLGDMETSNLATATTLDRPTELAMIEKQERWRETLITIYTYILKVDQGAESGRLKEAKSKLRIVECKRIRKPNGDWVYEASQGQPDDQIQLKCTFPAIREGDMPANVVAITDAMTLQNKGGQVVGIDEREGVKLLYEQLGKTDAQELLDKQYPPQAIGVKGTPGYIPKYDPNRTKALLTPPVPKAVPGPGGVPQAPGGQVPAPGQNAPAPVAPAPPAKAAEALGRLIEALKHVDDKTTQ